MIWYEQSVYRGREKMQMKRNRIRYEIPPELLDVALDAMKRGCQGRAMSTKKKLVDLIRKLELAQKTNLEEEVRAIKALEEAQRLLF